MVSLCVKNCVEQKIKKLDYDYEYQNAFNIFPNGLTEQLRLKASLSWNHRLVSYRVDVVGGYKL